MSEVPNLETARLRLRQFRPADLDAFAEAYADDAFASTITAEGRAVDRAAAWRACALGAGSWAVDGHGLWVAERRDSGVPIGYVGPYAPPGWPGFEVGWAIFPEHWRQGFASEGAAAALDWCFRTLGTPEIIHLTLQGNVASEGVARSLGAVMDGTWDSKTGGTLNIWHSTPASFAASRAWQRHVAASADSA